MIEMKTTVQILDLITGRAIETGIIIGRILHDPPFYDVRVEGGGLNNLRINVPADRIVKVE